MDSFTQFDGNLLIGIQHALNADWLTPAMKVITYFGEAGIFWIILVLALMISKKTRRLGIICALSLLATFIACNLCLKPLIGRTRPWVLFADVVRMMPDPGDASFPSGHTANSMGPAWAAFVATLPARTSSGKREYVPDLGWSGESADPKKMHILAVLLVILAVLVGISRVYLGMHYPSDVVCGYLLGMICAVIVYAAVTAAEKKRGQVLGSVKQNE